MTCAYMSHPLDRYVSELSYIHAKLMIVDDRRVIVRIPSFILLNTMMTFPYSRWGQPTSMIVVRGCVTLGPVSSNRRLAHASTARATVTPRSLLSSRMKIPFKVQWMGARTERPASPRPCDANSSAVRIYRHTSRAYFPT